MNMLRTGMLVKRLVPGNCIPAGAEGVVEHVGDWFVVAWPQVKESYVYNWDRQGEFAEIEVPNEWEGELELL